MIFYLKNNKGQVIRNPNESLKAVMHWREDDLKKEAKNYKNHMVECWSNSNLEAYEKIETIFNIY